MFKNQKEHLIFVLMICTTMVFIMSCYNVAMMEGFSLNVFKHAVLGFIPAFLFALVGDLFIVGNIVKVLAGKILKEGDSMVKVGMTMSFLTGCGMVLWMSCFGTAMNFGFGPDFFSTYITVVAKNFIFAVPLNLLIVSPIIRGIFFKMFPPIPKGEVEREIKIEA
ncbi:DUF2798 domain-containing protein [Terrisporobacter sp.]